MAEQRGHQNQSRGVSFQNVCSSHPEYPNTDDEALSTVRKEKQAFLDLVRRQVDKLQQRTGGSAGYQPYSRNNPNQQSGVNRWGHRPGFCSDEGNSPSNTNLGYDPYSFTDWNNNDNRDPWNIRPDGPCPPDLKKTGQSFANPCTDRPDKSHSKNTVLFKGNQSRPNESKSTVNLGTLPWNPNVSPSNTRIDYNVCDDRPGTRNRGNRLQQELLKAQSYCNRTPGLSPSATDICLARTQGHPRTPEVSRSNLCPRPSSRVRSLVKLLMIILVVICLVLLLAFVGYQLCALIGFCGGGCKLERTIHYVPY